MALALWTTTSTGRKAALQQTCESIHQYMALLTQSYASGEGYYKGSFGWSGRKNMGEVGDKKYVLHVEYTFIICRDRWYMV
jgi:hypothetical protein